MLDSLKPTQKARVIDLVEAAGLDVSDWGNFKGGIKRAATNPKYCYEWAFVEEGNAVVLNLWHRNMEEVGGHIIHRFNFRDRGFRAQKEVWHRRDKRLDEAIRTAMKQNLPIRVLVIEGQRRDIDHDGGKASSINFRKLDSVSWAVTEYNQDTGECTLTRGMLMAQVIDQFKLAELDPHQSPEKKIISASAFVRDAKVRELALQRSNGKCEWCLEPGFKMANGGIYLESHHIIPLSEGGTDLADNIIVLCPNHHREAHHGMNRTEMRAELKKRTRIQ